MYRVVKQACIPYYWLTMQLLSGFILQNLLLYKFAFIKIVQLSESYLLHLLFYTHC